jgi:CheY-like chemotaxis protein
MTRSEQAKPRVLCVEDDPDLQYLMSCALREQGFETYYAFTGPEGSEKAAALRPDLVLLDLMLPLMSGPDVLKGLMEDPATRGTPVIVMTAYAGEEDFFESKLRKLGASAYLRKPVKFEELVPLMRRLLAESRAAAGTD